MMSEKHPTGKHLPHPVKPVLFCSHCRIFHMQQWNHLLCWPEASAVCWPGFSAPGSMDAAVC